MTSQFIGTKIVTAWEQASKDGEEGYTVKYQDGYTSWCPKAVFEAANIDIGHVSHYSYEQQLVFGQIAGFKQRLAEIISSDTLSKLLSLEADVLRLHIDILQRRVAEFAHVPTQQLTA